MDLFGSLLFQVTGQQLSVAATRRTIERMTSLFVGHLPSPEELLAAEPGDLRAAGLSWRKVNTLRDLAERLTDGRLDMERLIKLPDDDFITELTTKRAVSDATFARARKLLGEQQVVDLTAVAGTYITVAMLLAMAEETVPPGVEPPFKPGEP